VKEILNGNKKYEFRKRIFKDRSKNSIFIYASSPMKKIVAHFQLGNIVEGHPDHLWEQFWDVSGIGEKEFFQYFAGRETGFAIQIEELMQYQKPIDPKTVFENFVPPQSFCYVDPPTNQPKFLKVKC
jgi:predicted transcriptional regulator